MPTEPVLPLRPEPSSGPFADDFDSPRERVECDACGAEIVGTPGGAGLLVWTRGDEVRYEEPPLCDECAPKIAVGALVSWAAEEEE